MKAQLRDYLEDIQTKKMQNLQVIASIRGKNQKEWYFGLIFIGNNLSGIDNIAKEKKMKWSKNVSTGNYYCGYKSKIIHRLAGKGPRFFYYIQEFDEHDKVFTSLKSAKKHIDNAIKEKQ